jgi:hypothetical protein
MDWEADLYAIYGLDDVILNIEGRIQMGLNIYRYISDMTRVYKLKYYIYYVLYKMMYIYLTFRERIGFDINIIVQNPFGLLHFNNNIF